MRREGREAAVNETRGEGCSSSCECEGEARGGGGSYSGEPIAPGKRCDQGRSGEIILGRAHCPWEASRLEDRQPKVPAHGRVGERL